MSIEEIDVEANRWLQQPKAGGDVMGMWPKAMTVLQGSDLPVEVVGWCLAQFAMIRAMSFAAPAETMELVRQIAAEMNRAC